MFGQTTFGCVHDVFGIPHFYWFPLCLHHGDNPRDIYKWKRVTTRKAPYTIFDIWFRNREKGLWIVGQLSKSLTHLWKPGLAFHSTFTLERIVNKVNPLIIIFVCDVGHGACLNGWHGLLIFIDVYLYFSVVSQFQIYTTTGMRRLCHIFKRLSSSLTSSHKYPGESLPPNSPLNG